MQYDVFLPNVFRNVLKYYKKKYPQVGEDLKQVLHLVMKNPDIGKTLQKLTLELKRSGFATVTSRKEKVADIALFISLTTQKT